MNVVVVVVVETWASLCALGTARARPHQPPRTHTVFEETPDCTLRAHARSRPPPRPCKFINVGVVETCASVRALHT